MILFNNSVECFTKRMQIWFDNIADILTKYEDNIFGVILFGSYARGKEDFNQASAHCAESVENFLKAVIEKNDEDDKYMRELRSHNLSLLVRTNRKVTKRNIISNCSERLCSF